MLKLTKLYDECASCDYRYTKGKLSGCVFPNHAPIDTSGESKCNTGEYVKHNVDESCIKINNPAEINIL